jgi:hypothetical protein
MHFKAEDLMPHLQQWQAVLLQHLQEGEGIS